ncbi:sodium:alanine symporter family protein [Ruminococcaceae bacterium OttesenSCG-928-A11]|nr:sodium:alanine symporter family protein [Ruminococcaceae bacterium OttesenSCG-928-A11]
MTAVYDAIMAFSNWLWGTPMLIILVGGSIYMTIRLGFVQIRHFPFMMKETFGKLFKKPEKGEGSVSPFQAATAALASTIGASNIVGVPVAIAFGGPGAVLWMIITALCGGASKFAEITLGIKYREKNAQGEFVGGPQYYLDKGLKAKKIMIPLGKIFAFFFMLEIIPSVATQTVSVVQTGATIGLPNWVSGLIVAVLVGLVVFGGLKRIVKVTEKLVPLMASIYIVFALIIVFANITALPSVIVLIFKHAFTPMAAVGGFAGSVVSQSISRGVARGTYSNEAGMGTASVAHATAVTDHPCRQACWGMFEIVVDTFMVCTITAFVVLTSGVWQSVSGDQAASMPALAFQGLLGDAIGGGIVTISILLFVISTIIVIIYYGEKQAEYIFGSKFAIVMRVVYIGAIFMGAFGGLEFLYSFLDLLLACIIVPNMIGLVIMAGDVNKLKNEFFGDPKYNPKAKIKATTEVPE